MTIFVNFGFIKIATFLTHMKLNFSFKVLIKATLLTGLQVVALAQYHFKDVGADSSGNIYFVDNRTVRPYQGFQVRKLQNETIVQLTMNPNCQERRIWVTKVERFSIDGQLIGQGEDRMEEIPYQEGTPPTNALKYYCSSVASASVASAPGW
jgi:hypothetical protein